MLPSIDFVEFKQRFGTVLVPPECSEICCGSIWLHENPFQLVQHISKLRDSSCLEFILLRLILLLLEFRPVGGKHLFLYVESQSVSLKKHAQLRNSNC